MIDRLEQATVGEIVATDFRAAGVFERFGIDFCCGGRRSLADACRAAAADADAVARALGDLPPLDGGDEDVTAWPLARLIDHIVDRHHAYVRAAMPEIAHHLMKIESAHGERHPELRRVVGYFDQLSHEFAQHLMKEEQVLFPYIRSLEEPPPPGGGSPMPSPFGTVENPIRMMEREHRDAADELRLLRELTGGFAVPADGCATYGVSMSELAEFERDLHRHVHLENNVLFPRAVALEQTLARQG